MCFVLCKLIYVFLYVPPCSLSLQGANMSFINAFLEQLAYQGMQDSQDITVSLLQCVHFFWKM